MVMLRTRVILFVLTLVVIIPTRSRAQRPNQLTPVDAALAFLEQQIVDPQIGLLDSLVEDNAPYVYTYDQALAAMAWMANGDTPKARDALIALTSLKRGPNGGFFHRYSAVSGASTERANLHLGHNAYVLQAFNMYYAKTDDTRFFQISKELAAFLKSRQESDGGLLGDAYNTWKSTENNLAAYVALNNYQRIVGSTLYNTAAQAIRGFLLDECWNAQQGRFRTGKGDDTVSTDVNALGVLTFGPDYKSGLDYVEGRTQLTYNIRGQRYITGFDLNTDKDTVWTEGTLQMSMAYGMVQETEYLDKAEFYLNEAMQVQHPRLGSFLQAAGEGSTGHGENFHPWQAVAPTAWFILASTNVNPFEVWS